MGRRILIISQWQRQGRNKGEPFYNRALRKDQQAPDLALSPPAKQILWNTAEKRWSSEEDTATTAWIFQRGSGESPGRLSDLQDKRPRKVWPLSAPFCQNLLHHGTQLTELQLSSTHPLQSQYTCLWSLNPQGSSGLRTLLYLKMSNEAQQLPFSSVFRLSQRYYLWKTFTVYLPPGASNLFLIYFHQITHFQLIFSCHLVSCLTDLLP